MRITFLTQWFDPEPAQFRGLPLARELVRRGHSVEVITGFPNYPTGRVYAGYRIRPWQRERIDGVDLLRVVLYPSHDRNPLARVANYASFAASASVLGPLLTKRSDVVYAYHPPPTVGLPAAVFRWLRDVPVVYHIADMWPESAVESGMLGTGRRKRVAEKLIGGFCNWVYANCDEITVLSPGFKEMLIARGVPSERIHVVYNWADDALFRPLPRDLRLAAELNLERRFNVVYAGNVGDFQGLDSVIAAASLLTDIQDFQFVIAGTGVAENRLKELVTRMHLRNVRFLGHRSIEQMPAINSLADVLLVHLRDLPFFHATIPGKTQVSLASGRPVLMGATGDAADIIRQSRSGLTVPPENPVALASAIRQLYALSPAERDELGKGGREFYLREMSLRAGADKMEMIFRKTAGRTPRPRGQRATWQEPPLTH